MLFVAKTFTSDKRVEYGISPCATREEAQSDWENRGVEVIEIIEVKTLPDHEMGEAVIRALVSTADGTDLLCILLTHLIKHQTL